MTPEEQILLQYVNREINKGKTQIVIPAQLILNVRKEVLEEIRRLCKLSGVKIEITTNPKFRIKF